MKKSIEVPYTASELRHFADVLDNMVVPVFGESVNEDSLTPLGKVTYQISLEVLRPDTDEVAGVIEYYDGWLGFYPIHED